MKTGFVLLLAAIAALQSVPCAETDVYEREESPTPTTPTKAQLCDGHSEVRQCEALNTGSDYNTLEARCFGHWHGICRVVSTDDTLDLDQYIYSVDLYNEDSNRGSKFGHLGVTFNVVDADNFDFVYFNPQSKYNRDCVRYGYKRGSTVNSRGHSRCSAAKVRGSTWFNVKIKVKAGRAQVFVDDTKLVTVTPHYSVRSQAGVMVWNGHANTVRYRNATISSL
nr:lectin 3-1 [Arenicola marina]